jgi:hypothetical protein
MNSLQQSNMAACYEGSNDNGKIMELNKRFSIAMFDYQMGQIKYIPLRFRLP